MVGCRRWAGAAVAALALFAVEVYSQDDGLEISGLVIDRTLTRGGRLFFSEISQQLSPLEDRPFTVEVLESIAPGRSSFVRLYVDQSLVFQAALDPLPGRVEDTAKQAMSRLSRFIANKRFQQQELETY